MGWLRAAVGVALIAAPAAPLRLSGREEPTNAAVLLMRTVGIRDLVLGLGATAAARATSARADLAGAEQEPDQRPDVLRWTTAALASDTLDTVASIVSVRSIGKRDAVSAALLSLSFVAADLWALRKAKAAPAP
jgi:hypothetical protein